MQPNQASLNNRRCDAGPCIGHRYTGKVDKVLPGDKPHMLMQLDGHAAVPRSLADKSIRAECSKAHAETQEMTLENKKLLMENKKLRLINDAVSNKLRYGEAEAAAGCLPGGIGLACSVSAAGVPPGLME